ncbi:MAG: membrane protein insertion efficiency factor YidD [Elusimicrobiota bacterium]
MPQGGRSQGGLRRRRVRYLLLEVLGLLRAIRAALLAPTCRFTPTCSRYAEEALTRHGVLRAVTLTAGRLLRCHPFHPGGWDPVPNTIFQKHRPPHFSSPPRGGRSQRPVGEGCGKSHTEQRMSMPPLTGASLPAGEGCG